MITWPCRSTIPRSSEHVWLVALTRDIAAAGVAPITSEETRTLMARVEVTSVLMFVVLGLITPKLIPLAEVPAIPVNAAGEVGYTRPRARGVAKASAFQHRTVLMQSHCRD
jgi:hypothetical protein